MKDRIIQPNSNGYLDLSNDNWSSADLQRYAKSIIASQARYVDFSDNAIDEAGAQILAEIVKESPNLEILKLAECLIYDEGLIKLSEALAKHPRLMTLDLSNNNIADEGLNYFAECLINSKPKSLAILNLSINRFTNASMENLAKSVAVCGIQEVDLSTNMIEDEGAEKFIQYNIGCCTIILDYTGVSDAMKEKIINRNKTAKSDYNNNTPSHTSQLANLVSSSLNKLLSNNTTSNSELITQNLSPDNVDDHGKKYTNNL